MVDALHPLHQPVHDNTLPGSMCHCTVQATQFNPVQSSSTQFNPVQPISIQVQPQFNPSSIQLNVCSWQFNAYPSEFHGCLLWSIYLPTSSIWVWWGPVVFKQSSLWLNLGSVMPSCNLLMSMCPCCYQLPPCSIQSYICGSLLSSFGSLLNSVGPCCGHVTLLCSSHNIPDVPCCVQ